MQDLQQSFSDYLKEQMEKQNFSTYDIERRSEGQVSHGTVWNILNLRVKEVKDSTLRVIATAIGRPPEEVIAKARGLLVGTDADEELSDYAFPQPYAESETESNSHS